jgi:predicted nucleic acid-binding protein
LSAGELVTAETHGTVTSRDPKDNKFLALAVSGHDYLTGDKDLLVLKSIGAIPIVSPAEFLAKIKETGA